MQDIPGHLLGRTPNDDMLAVAVSDMSWVTSRLTTAPHEDSVVHVTTANRSRMMRALYALYG